MKKTSAGLFYVLLKIISFIISNFDIKVKLNQISLLSRDLTTSKI